MTEVDTQVHSVEEAFLYFLKHKRMQPATRDQYYNVLAIVQRATFATTNIEKLNAAIVREFFFANPEFEGFKRSTLYVYYTKICAVIAFYCREFSIQTKGRIDGVIKNEVNYKTENFLTQELLHKLQALELSPGLSEGRTLLLIQCFTGMSVADVIGIKDLMPHTVDPQWFTYYRTKGGHKYLCEIPMNPYLSSLLNSLTWPVKIGARGYNVRLQSIGKKLGQHISAHSGRHTFGVLMIEAGFSLEAIRKMMGHSSIKMTERVYAKITKRRVNDERVKNSEQLNKLVESFQSLKRTH